jgi:ribosomal protein S27E
MSVSEKEWKNAIKVNPKFSKEGLIIPNKCPLCGSKRTVVATYADNSKFVECEGCWTVLHEPSRKEIILSKKRMERMLKKVI